MTFNYFHISPLVRIDGIETNIDFYLSIPSTIELLDRYSYFLSDDEKSSVDFLRAIKFKNGKAVGKVSDFSKLEDLAYSFLSRLDEMDGPSLYRVLNKDGFEYIEPIYN